MLEGLEPRRHYARVEIAIEGKRLLITGTERDDTIYVSGQRHRIEITVNGQKQTLVSDAVRTLRVDGGRGDDVINSYGFFGPAQLLGSRGRDELFGGDQNDTLVGGVGNDTLYGSEGNDSLRGDGGKDYMDGNGGADTLIGGANDDELHGGLGRDHLNGNNGDDHLFDKQGVNVFHGGGGTDRAVTNDYHIGTGIESGGFDHFSLTRQGGRTVMSVLLVDGSESLLGLKFRPDGVGDLTVLYFPGSNPPFANSHTETRDVTDALTDGLYLTFADFDPGENLPSLSLKFLLPQNEA